MCNQVHQEQIVAGETTQNIVENPAVQEQVIVQENSELQVMERIQEQIVDTTGLVNPQFSSTAVEASAPQVVGSLPRSEKFDAPVNNQVHQEQIVAGEMTLNRVGNPAVQEQVIVLENSELQVMEQIQEQVVDTTVLVNPQFSSTAVKASAPQVVGSLPRSEKFDVPVYNQVHQEQIVAGRDDPEQSWKPSCARTGDRSGNSSTVCHTQCPTKITLCLTPFFV